MQTTLHNDAMGRLPQISNQDVTSVAVITLFSNTIQRGNVLKGYNVIVCTDEAHGTAERQLIKFIYDIHGKFVKVTI